MEYVPSGFFIIRQFSISKSLEYFVNITFQNFVHLFVLFRIVCTIFTSLLNPGATEVKAF